MKDLGKASYVLGIRLSQQMCSEHILKRFIMQLCSSIKAPIAKGDRFSIGQCPRNDIERDKMKEVPYFPAVDNMTFVQVCTSPDIDFFCWHVG